MLEENAAFFSAGMKACHRRGLQRMILLKVTVILPVTPFDSKYTNGRMCSVGVGNLTAPPRNFGREHIPTYDKLARGGQGRALFESERACHDASISTP